VAEKPRYWDVQRCAWVDYVGPSVPGTPADEPSAPAADATVPEQRPGIAIAPPLVAGTPD
jgi:hypothetical protein